LNDRHRKGKDNLVFRPRDSSGMIADPAGRDRITRSAPVKQRLNVTSLQGQRVTLKQHREILVLAGWVALLVGCVEYDTGQRHAAETTRQAALSLGVEADHGEIIAWAHEMRAWINLTTGDYNGVIAAARNGTDVTPHYSLGGGERPGVVEELKLQGLVPAFHLPGGGRRVRLGGSGMGLS
jgi:hypothetical protein